MWKLLSIAIVGLILIAGFILASVALETSSPGHYYTWVNQTSNNSVICATLRNAIDYQNFASTVESITLTITLTNQTDDACTVYLSLSGVSNFVTLEPSVKQQTVELNPDETKTLTWVVSSDHRLYEFWSVKTTWEEAYISFAFISAHLGLTIAQMRLGLLIGIVASGALIIPWFRAALRVPEDTL